MTARRLCLTLWLCCWGFPASAADLLLVIDDIGNNRALGEQLLTLPAPVNMAFLPHTPYAARLATKAAAQGHTVLLHAPMANKSGAKLGPGGLYPEMSKDEFDATLNADLDAIPAVSGLNNHMGSLLTQDCERMGWVMAIARQRQLFFIDSRTTTATCARQAALQAGVPVLGRDVFLDNDRSAEALARQFDKAVAIASKYGKAVLIGHPYPETITFLQQRLSQPASSSWQLAALNDRLAVTAAAKHRLASLTTTRNMSHRKGNGEGNGEGNGASNEDHSDNDTAVVHTADADPQFLKHQTGRPESLSTAADQSIGILRLPTSNSSRLLRIHLQP